MESVDLNDDSRSDKILDSSSDADQIVDVRNNYH